MSTLSVRKAFVLLVFAGLVIRTFILSLPEAEILARWGSDDLFYYSQIAGHIANGDGATFDGLNATNGFQPLFMAILTPFGKVFLNDPEAALRGILLFVSILNLITVFQVIALFSSWGLKNLGLISGGLLFIHPKILSVTFHGTEAALTVLMVVLALRAVQQVEQGKNLFWSALAFTGLVLTRFDMSLLLACLFLFLLWKRVPFRQLLLINALPGFALACWLGANWYIFGSLLPDSGVAKSLHGALIAEMSGSSPGALLFSNFKGVIHTLLMAESKLSIFALIFVGLGVFRLLAFEYSSRHGSVPYLMILTIGGFLIMAAALIKLNSFRDWYLMPLFLAVIWLMSLGLDTIRHQFKYGNWLLIVVPLLIWGEAQWQPRNHMAVHYLEAANYIEENLPPGSTIGAFNAGFYGARLGGQYTVINLDGVVNHTVLEYSKKNKLFEFIEAGKIELLVDHSGSVGFFSNFSGTSMHDQFDKIHEILFDGETSDITIFKKEIKALNNRTNLNFRALFK